MKVVQDKFENASTGLDIGFLAADRSKTPRNTQK